LTIARGLAYQAVAMAGLGAAVGLAAAIAAARWLFPVEFRPSGGGFVLSVALAAVVSVITTVLARYLLARRALRRDVTARLQRADARFVTGSDVRVTPNLGAALPGNFAERLRVRGVRAISAVDRVPDVVVGTDSLLFAGVDPRTFPSVAPLDHGFFTDISPAA